MYLYSLIKNNQLRSYFILTFIISWIFFYLPFFISVDELSNFLLIIIGGAGPALAAIIISSIVTPQRISSPQMKKWALFILTFLVSITLMVIYLEITLSSLDILPIILIVVNAVIVGYIISGGLSGIEGIQKLLNKLYIWNIPLRWYLFALIFYPAVLFLSLLYGIYGSGSSVNEIFNQVSGNAVYGLIITYGYVGLTRGPLREEIGWRGFALPRLQNLHSPLVGSIILGVIWIVWHLPLHFNGLYPVGIEGFLDRFYYLGLIFLFTWLYNHTKGSLLLTTLFHTSANTAGTILIFAQSEPVAGLSILLINLSALLVIIKDKMWRKLPEDSPAVYPY